MNIINNIIMSSPIINPPSTSFTSSLLLSLLFALLSNCQSCVLSCVSTQDGCIVCFNQCTTGNLTDFVFDSCSQIQGSQLSNNNGGSTTLQYDLNTCAKQCCGSDLARFQNPQFSACSGKQASSKEVVIIVISVVVIIFVTLCCVVSGNSHIREIIINWITRKKTTHVQDKPLPHSSDLSISQFQPHTSKTKLGKKMCNFMERDSQCSICLDHQSNTSTKCGHAYHVSCLYQWIIRKEECPLCKSKQVQKVYVFCRKCKVNRTKIALKEVAFLGIKQLNDFQCKQCKSSLK